MPGNTALPSVLGNAVIQRQKLSAVRQRLSLEPSPQAGRMRPVAPSPPEGADMDVKGAAVQAGQAPDVNPDMFDPEKNPITAHPQYQAMAQTAQTFLDNNQNGIDDRQESAPLPNSAPQAPSGDPAGAGAATGSLVNDPNMLRALMPLTNFFRQNGRLPSIDELREMEDTRRDLRDQGMI